MTILVLLLALTRVPAQTECKPQFAPLNTGSHSGASNVPFWRKDEAGEWDGEGWLGWRGNRDDTLRPVRLIVRDRPKDPGDDSEEVTVEWAPDVTFAVRCIPNLRAGRIGTTNMVNESSLEPKHPLNISLGSRRYELRLQSAREDLYDAQVILSDGHQKQVLYSADGFADEPHFDIVWAGDLDRDGKLDLIVNLQRKYSWHPYRLLLSSKAVGAELVGQAAIFETGD
jgi:hypothetical protein